MFIMNECFLWCLISEKPDQKLLTNNSRPNKQLEPMFNLSCTHVNAFVLILWFNLNDNYVFHFFYPLWPLFGQLYVHLSQNWDSDGHCLMSLNLDWFNCYVTKYKYLYIRFFAILYKNTHLCFLNFCVLCHNFCTK